MQSVGVAGDDVSALVLLIQFAKRKWKGVATPDFGEIEVLVGLEQLEDVPKSWFR
jgi:hypothetical protein